MSLLISSLNCVVEEAFFFALVKGCSATAYFEAQPNGHPHSTIDDTPYARYINNTIVIWFHGSHALLEFLRRCNQTASIKFTYESSENNRAVPFLDVEFTTKDSGKVEIGLYRKSSVPWDNTWPLHINYSASIQTTKYSELSHSNHETQDARRKLRAVEIQDLRNRWPAIN